MTENWDSGHEWLWRRRRRLQRIAPLLLIAGLALGFAAGRASRHHSTVLMSTAGPVTAATRAASTAEAGTNSASPTPRDANSDDRALSMTANPGPSASPTLTVNDRPSRGAAHPTLTIVEFSDFQCPFCLRHERDVAPVLLATGSRFADKIRYVIKSFPLAVHPLARGAAEAAECAKLQGKYWAFHALLFAHQDQLDPDSLRAHAHTVGLDDGAFDRCVTTHATAPIVDRDLQEGANLGITGTPTFFVNGLRIPGAQPLTLFETVLDRLLAGQPVQLVGH